MKREELIKYFDNEKTTNEGFDVFETTKLLEIIVTMKNNHKIHVVFSEREEFIDVSSNHYIGLGGTLISPIKDIEKIIVKWR